MYNTTTKPTFTHPTKPAVTGMSTRMSCSSEDDIRSHNLFIICRTLSSPQLAAASHVLVHRILRQPWKWTNPSVLWGTKGAMNSWSCCYYNEGEKKRTQDEDSKCKAQKRNLEIKWGFCGFLYGIEEQVQVDAPSDSNPIILELDAVRTSETSEQTYYTM